MPSSRSRRGAALGHRHAAVLAARAADGERDVALALADVARRRPAPSRRTYAVDELARALLTQDVVAPPASSCPVRSRSSGIQYGLGRKRMSTTKSASSGTPYLKPNDMTVDPQPRAAPAAERPASTFLRELVDVEAGGVDDQVGLAAQVGEQLALAHDAVEQPALALQRVRAADRLEPADQHLVGGVQEHQRRGAQPRSRSSASALCRSVEERRGPARRPRRRSAARRPLRRRPVRPCREQQRAAAGCRRRTSRGPPGRWPRCDRPAPLMPGDDRRARVGVAGWPRLASLGSSIVRPSSMISPVDEVDGRRCRTAAWPTLPQRVAASAAPDAGHRGDLLDGGRPQLLQRAEVPQQRLAPGLAQPRDVVQDARDVIALDRRWRWKVMANRCASSRTRCSR